MPRASLVVQIALGAALVLQLLAPLALAAEPVYISIIIDDIGHSPSAGKRAINLPADLTYAVIPDAIHATQLARYAHESGKEVMLHMPMENVHRRPMGSLALTSGLTTDQFVSNFTNAVERVPFAIGINNHMGSALTQEPGAMQLFMSLVRQHQLYFVDSRTTPMTVASDMAQRQDIRTASRDVFLDNERNLFAIDQQFRKLIRKARQKGSAIGIGHPYGVTLEYLERALPMMQAENVQIIPVSDMLMRRNTLRQLAAKSSDSAEQVDQPGV